ncbi:MAG: hybrid sensor histidine kinase/response regulator [Verrucomicrobiota bacterium]
MQKPDYYKNFAVLYVDDEEKSLINFTRAYKDDFRIFTAASAQEGLAILEKHADEIAILITDQRMPGEKGVWLLEKARQLRPHMIRILATAYADMEAAIAAVNSGSIYKYITKPWNPSDLEQTLKRSYEFFVTQQERDALLKEKMSSIRNMMVAEHIVRLGLLASGMSHHIRNSLVAVKTFLDLAPEKMHEEKSGEHVVNPEFWKEYHQDVQGQIEKINNMLKDLWAASDNSSPEFSDCVKLHEVMDQVIQKISPELILRKIRVENAIPDSLSPLMVDKLKFYRLFELLLRDEIVSLPEGCTVHITASGQEGEINVLFTDNGPGLSSEALKLVFDPFALRTDTPREYGINLMACFFIVHHHGGTIEALNDGTGTTFHLRLPIDPNQFPLVRPEDELQQKILLNETVWEKLIASK